MTNEVNITKEEILIKVKDLLSHQFDIAPKDITLEARLNEDLDIDSIDAMNLLAEYEKETGVGLDPLQLISIRTIGDVIDTLYATMSAKKEEAPAKK